MNGDQCFIALLGTRGAGIDYVYARRGPSKGFEGIDFGFFYSSNQSLMHTGKGYEMSEISARNKWKSQPPPAMDNPKCLLS